MWNITTGSLIRSVSGVGGCETIIGRMVTVIRVPHVRHSRINWIASPPVAMKAAYRAIPVVVEKASTILD